MSCLISDTSEGVFFATMCMIKPIEVFMVETAFFVPQLRRWYGICLICTQFGQIPHHSGNSAKSFYPLWMI